MKFFLDTTDHDEIMAAQEKLVALGSKLDGITTNPTTASAFLRKQSRYKTVKDVVLKITDLVNGRISVETLGTPDYRVETISKAHFVDEANTIHEWHPHFDIKIPCVPEGIETTRELYGKIQVNMTLCFSLDDIHCAAKAGATKTSLFVGRIDERNGTGTVIAYQSVNFLRGNDYEEAEFLFASTRNIEHVMAAYSMGSDIITMPYKIFILLDPEDVVAMQHGEKPRVPYEPRPVEITKKDFIYTLKEEGVISFLRDAQKADYRILDAA